MLLDLFTWNPVVRVFFLLMFLKDWQVQYVVENFTSNSPGSVKFHCIDKLLRINFDDIFYCTNLKLRSTNRNHICLSVTWYVYYSCLRHPQIMFWNTCSYVLYSIFRKKQRSSYCMKYPSVSPRNLSWFPVTKRKSPRPLARGRNRSSTPLSMMTSPRLTSP